MYISSKPLGVWFFNGGDMESGSPADRNLLIVLFCLSMIVLVGRKFPWLKAIKDNPWLILVVLYMLVSIFWSSMPAISFKRWIKELIAVTMVFLTMSEPDPKATVLKILRRSIYVLIPLSMVLIKYFPIYGRQFNRWTGERMWIGAMTQKNGLAWFSAAAMIFLLWSIVQRRKEPATPIKRAYNIIDLSMFLLALVLFLGPRVTPAHSATSSMSLLAGLCVLAFLYGRERKGKGVTPRLLRTAALILIVYGTVTPFLGKLSVLDVSSYFGRTESLTGRSAIWATLVPLAMEKPLLGHGVGGFWTTGMREITSSHAHNGYLDTILTLGFFGLFLLTILICNCCNRAAKVLKTDFAWGALFLCYLFAILVHNIAESSFDTLTTSRMAIILLFSVTSAHLVPDLPGLKKEYADPVDHEEAIRRVAG